MTNGADPSGAEEAAVLESEVVLEANVSERDRARIGPFRRLYRGLTTYDFVGRKRTWFTISAVVIVVGMASLGVKGLNLGIDFQGGSTWTVIAPGVTQQQAVSAATHAGLTQPTVEILGGKTVQVQADLNGLPSAKQKTISNAVIAALAKLAKTTNLNKVSSEFVGPTWGGQVTEKAVEALIAFFVAVVAYISIRFEPKMALAAFLAMLHDLMVTVGVFAFFGFQVTPDTVIAILTILGYSLYDTVVVFDRVRDNSKPFAVSGRMTYSGMVNLSMNQTLARSINTSLVAILPVFSVVLIGADLLGATTLQDYGVALVVGLLSGAYSSIFIASPLLAVLKEREPRFKATRARLMAKGQRAEAYSAQDAARLSIAAPAAHTGSSAPRRTTTTPTGAPPAPRTPVPSATTIQASTPIITPRARKQKKR